MTSELKNLIKERATVKAQLSRLNNYIRQLETVDIPALERRKQKLEEYYVSFSNVQSRIEAIDDNPQQDQNREDFEILYYECGDFIDRELHKLNRIPPHSNTAIHLEVVSDLTTEAFLASLKRFFARRGYSQIIYSDNGTNFVGAKNKLSELFALLRTEKHNDKISRYLVDRNIQWKFSPPRSPHFGGLWESAVKSFKGHLVRTIGDTMFTYEELSTIVTEIEAVLNSRPLTPLSPDPNDFCALTPAHFLIVWQHTQRIKQHFWSRWYKEYLNELNIRTKWRQNSAGRLKVRTLVLIKEENLPPCQWRLGRIWEIHPGEDNIVRVVTIRTNHGIYKRSVKNICPLPIREEIPDLAV
ncbi:hypothetical protein ANTPLA_LOCUS8900 [Anthophora plagiata]